MDSLMISYEGQQTEVPLDFEIFTIKVVGQTLNSSSTGKMSKLLSNGNVKLGLVNFSILYCGFHSVEVPLRKTRNPN